MESSCPAWDGHPELPEARGEQAGTGAVTKEGQTPSEGL